MTPLNSRLQLAMLNRKKSRNALEKGFTLVELMIVIVIVGVLSAVALPNFLSQTGKAKGTEAKSQISAIMKDGAAIYQQGGMSELLRYMGSTDPADTTLTSTCEALGGPVSKEADPNVGAAGDADVKTLFDYTCTATEAAGEDDSATPDNLTVLAVANSNDTSIEDNQVQMSINLQTGTIETSLTGTSRLFGGTKADV